MSRIALFLFSFCSLFSLQTASADRAPRGYDLLHSHPQYAFRYSAPGEPVRRGAKSERFEVRDGYCKADDCAADRLRSEIMIPTRKAKSRVGRSIWFGWSFHISQLSSELRKNGTSPQFGQWKTAAPNSPTITFIAAGGKGRGDVYVRLGDMAAKNNNVVAGAKWGFVCKRHFSVSQAMKGWVDVVMTTNFSSRSDGYIKIWVNGAQTCDYRGQIVATQSARDYAGPNHRRGIFIGSTKTWRERAGNKPIPTIVVFYDEFLVGNKRIDVDTRMREAAGLPAKD
ncbi:MAG: heparin lyase I family protein [Sedimentitalea sp.]|nr:heparin lyase I family protein [Sedimentitalea sp.]